MKELYFHIGLPKTGTSALQKFCDMNRDVLRKKGIYYPKGDIKQESDDFLGFLGNAYGLFGEYAKAFKKEKLSCTENLKNMFKSNEVVLLSSENWWIWGGLIKIIYALQTFFEPEKIAIKIIVYLRRQDEHIESLWNQGVKAGRCVCDRCWEYTQKEMFNSNYDYRKLLSDISKIVGRENIICRIYNSEKYSAENTIYAEFMSIFGIDDISDFELPKFQVNPSLSKNMVEIRRIFNSIPNANIMSSILYGIRGGGGVYEI